MAIMVFKLGWKKTEAGVVVSGEETLRSDSRTIGRLARARVIELKQIGGDWEFCLTLPEGSTVPFIVM
ncbi:MAG: hypothetical protein CEO12_682 [Parcubacteria group bacterium Gr01-1014_46]|nr:MAG: hypothetical protein CEO12_682 [Parcubacteria group bacterium Gr01-1014_46]